MEKQDSLNFLDGLRSGVSLAVGYIPVALTFGLLAKTTGLSLFETFLMSALVFGGASQYMSLSMLAVQTGIIEIVMTTFIVNIRHFLFSATLNQLVEKDSPWKKAFYSFFAVTDESFAVAALRKEKLTTGYMIGLGSIGYVSWVFWSAAGHFAGAAMPAVLQESMSIALYAMFIGLLVPPLKKQRKVLLLAGAAALFNTVFQMNGILSAGWSIVCATLLSAVLIEWLYQFRTEGKRNYV
ncbi:AzlC family ABC transporter permease [Bacillus sp. GM2]|jgi:4-azaleucine resistance transporter AzlC|uniref:Inner membrane protein YgaZ n=1 Tax=Bacillus licheniformis TaxID=1402 RepID=A0A415J053_BACLI|nr:MULTISPECIES: AzlC family ABC transporter permease [Bacillus]MBY8349608.1 branched-chain amino acid ABC transporter permease [Bacillus sp. PCH94]MDP4082959.1 AzlC family ABC transporter permease [Bacillota bacterium]APJ26287.1 branched-chain amino acid ABC transporter permease [Bacillus sp. H15-1]ASV14654.1 branched-chain amino acid ABC transporter permease [Bacillus sp. 1s-1]AVI48843.1 putative membrane protein [Bacillus licheniformis]